MFICNKRAPDTHFKILLAFFHCHKLMPAINFAQCHNICIESMTRFKFVRLIIGKSYRKALQLCNHNNSMRSNVNIGFKER